jgi:hypothetical protein
MPEVVADAKDYDDLLARSYAQLGKETKQQFDSLPVNTSFHRNGEGNYSNSKQMLNDIFNNRHLYVYQGGDPHDFLNEVDPKTGLNTNEMFRAVHDFYGHAVHGNQFGPKGEEEAWAAHGGMFSPLARLAMSSETRGQNSFVNYTPINAKLKAEIAKQEEAAYHARRLGNHEAEAEFLQNKRDLLSHFQYAPQKSVLLPPEMVSEKYEGGMPSYLKDLIQPQHGIEAELTHFSHDPNLSMTDPSMYGKGIKGAEASRLEDPSAVKQRTYFYEGRPEKGEPGLGVHRYGAKVSNLYPAEADPENLRMLALEANRTPMTAMVNPGTTSGSQAYTDMERLAKEYGYKGVLSRGTSMPTAAVFEPTPVRKIAKGGLAGFLKDSNVKKRLYHGTAKDFGEFRHEHQYSGEGGSHSGSGFYFTDNPESASRYSMMKNESGSNVMPVHLNIKKPLHFDWEKGETTGANLKLTPAQVKSVMLAHPKIKDEDESPLNNWGDIRGSAFHKTLNDAVKSYAGSSMLAALRNDFFGNDHERWLRALHKATGYDSGTTITPTGERHYIAWFPEQIKSAIGNRGTYDPTSPDITKAKGGLVHLARGGRVTHAHHLDIEERPL